MKQLCSIILVVALFYTNNLFAEKAPIKFGKITSEEMEMTFYDKDSTASAVVLCDYQTVKIEYIQSIGFMQRINRNLRIKILKKEGYDWAKIEIDLRKKYDQLSKLKATTYNLVNNKPEKTKLDNNQIFNVDQNKYWETTKFEMPAVKEGSVIDIEYSILSESFWIRDWYFQTEIPTILNEYHVFIPEYYYYKQLEKGYFPITEKSENKRNIKINITENNRMQNGMVTNTKYENYQIDYDETEYAFKSVDVPAFIVEDYISCKKNYLSCIQFELGSIKWPNKPIKNYYTTWPAIGRELMEDEDFGGRIRGGLVIRSEVKAIEALNLSDKEKIEAAVSLIKNKMAWNNKHSIYSFSTSKAWKDGEGSCGDINLLLTAALRDLGLGANPVILSTREHGMIHPAQIILDQYNYVIASVKLGENTILIDATDKNTPIGILPERCLNGKGRLIDKNGGSWIDLNPQTKFISTYQTKYKIQEDGSISGNLIEKHEGYAGISKRNWYQNFNNENEFIDKQQVKTGFEITLDSISNPKAISEPFIVTYNFEDEKSTESMGDLLLIDPIIINKQTKNPFKLEVRDYPVDYSYPHLTTYMATILVPEGYSIENLPKPKRFVMPDKTVSFLYSINTVGSEVVIVSRFSINKTIFLPEEYQNLKAFYNQLIDTQNEKIVLKKTT